MKKIFSLLFASVIALAFAGCSGDLHDYGDAPNPTLRAVPGAFNTPTQWDNTAAWTTADDSTHTYTYTFTAAAAEIEWKALVVSGNWNGGAYGGTSDTVTEIDAGGSAVELTYDNGTGGYKNAKLAKLATGSGYELTVYCELGKVYAKVVEVASPLNLIDNRTYYVQGSFNNWSEGSLTVSGSTADNNTYTYTFTAVADNQFGLATSGWATKYTGATLSVGGDYVQLIKGAEKNDSITGCNSGSSYTITFKTDKNSNIYAKVSVAN
jgi:hypothetical protein